MDLYTAPATSSRWSTTHGRLWLGTTPAAAPVIKARQCFSASRTSPFSTWSGRDRPTVGSIVPALEPTFVCIPLEDIRAPTVRDRSLRTHGHPSFTRPTRPAIIPRPARNAGAVSKPSLTEVHVQALRRSRHHCCNVLWLGVKRETHHADMAGVLWPSRDIDEFRAPFRALHLSRRTLADAMVYATLYRSSAGTVVTPACSEHCQSHHLRAGHPTQILPLARNPYALIASGASTTRTSQHVLVSRTYSAARSTSVPHVNEEKLSAAGPSRRWA